MTKIKLIELVAQKAKIKKAAAERAINTFVGAIKDTLDKGNSFTVTGFGTFFASKRGARMGRNPKTGQQIQIPAIRTVRFRPSAKMKKRM
ncbi:MAG TPA: HU family DNA-binding protein [Nitrospiria bacterium]|jgi:DNA-binding protein HU-beta|nr:HU family DNA-binding protein [Nitrospiria bacterium]